MEESAEGPQQNHIIKEKIPCLDGFVTYTDSSPENLKDEVPVLLVPGWGATINTFEPGIARINKMGRRSISLEFPRKDVLGVGRDGHEIQDEGERKAEAVYSVMKAKDEVDKFDIIAHSEGSVNALIAATFMPERVRNIVLVNPAGLIGKDRFLRLAGGFSRLMGQDVLSSAQSVRSKHRRGEYLQNINRKNLEAGKYIGQNPMRALSEVRYLVNSDSTQLVKALTDSGVGVGILATSEDPVFPEPKMREMLKEQELAQFYTIKGGHNDLIGNPQVYMTEAVEMLERMRVQQEIGVDKFNIVGDKLVMKTEEAEKLELMRLQEEIGADKVDIIGDKLVMKESE